MRFLLVMSLMVGACFFGLGKTHADELPKSPEVVITAKLTNARLQKGEYDVTLLVDLHCSFQNLSRRPVLVFKESLPYLKGGELAKSPRGHRDYGGDCLFQKVYYAPAMHVVEREKRKQLDKSQPPEEFIQAIPAGTQLEFDCMLALRIPNKRTVGGWACDAGWEEIGKLSEVWLKVFWNHWPNTFEELHHVSEKLFGKRLQKRWEKHGWLLLDSIDVEPIRIDLSQLQSQK